ncbi:MAG: helix-turn-helix transcriptional regulator [Ilumatobacteraceae bacterium]|nr:helix-turn-helix transcriptional regulator [Ilumatobacteraceae bacterium]
MPASIGARTIEIVRSLAATLDRPKSSVAYHVDTLVDAGLLAVVRTRGATTRWRHDPNRSCPTAQRPSGCKSLRARTTGDDRRRGR